MESGADTQPVTIVTEAENGDTVIASGLNDAGVTSPVQNKCISVSDITHI